MRKGFLLQPKASPKASKSDSKVEDKDKQDAEPKPKDSSGEVTVKDENSTDAGSASRPHAEPKVKCDSDAAALEDLGLQKFTFDEGTDISIGFDENGQFCIRTKPSELS